jgi:hypothetical protein
MPMTLEMTELIQLIIGLGLINVWLFRPRSETSYRGRSAKNLKEEFAAYGLPIWFYYLVGAVKITSALALIAAIWVPVLVLPATGAITVLMIGALAAHLKVNDPILKSLPAFLMLIMTLSLSYMSIGSA